ncbi:hypothetical protein QZH41_006457 [Actinostola sp. cb2023]|nr:hypothetical protein QZH41_006457 [Actinostola sp. cb2023]
MRSGQKADLVKCLEKLCKETTETPIIEATALDGAVIVQILGTRTATTFQEYIDMPGALLAAMKDGASVNKAALQQVKFFFPQLLDVTCFSHTIDNVGKHFEFRVLDTFAQYWVSMFSHSAAVRLAWKTKTGTAMRSYSPTRWWSKWETMKQVLDYFGDVEPFLRENDQLVPATRVHLLEIFNSPADSKDLELELAAFVDGGNHFVSATYYLEGDGPLVFSCYERLATVSHSVALANYPNVEGVARRQANGNVPVFNQLVARAKACINPGLQFYQRKVSQEFYDIVRAFRSARLCCPVQVQQLHPTVASVEELRKFSFLDDDGIIQGLTPELPRYMAIADGTALETEEEKLLWWSRNGEATLPNWSSAVKKVLLVQPSSASAERVFSLMKNFFGNQQDAALEETVEASVMLRYNQNQRRKVQELGLQIQYQNDHRTYNFIRKLMALPFLPVTEIAATFQYLENRAATPAMLELTDYFKRNWVESAIWPPTD